MTQDNSINRTLAKYLAQIAGFEVQATDPQTKQEVENLLNGYDRTALLAQFPLNEELQELLEDPATGEEQIFDILDPLLTSWAVGVLSEKQFAATQTIAVRFIPSNRRS